MDVRSDAGRVADCLQLPRRDAGVRGDPALDDPVLGPVGGAGRASRFKALFLVGDVAAVASGAAARNDRYTIRSTPAWTAASTTPRCSATRSRSSCAETKNNVDVPLSTFRRRATSSYEPGAIFGTFDLRRARLVAHDQALRNAFLREPPRNTTADPAAGSGDRYSPAVHGRLSHLSVNPPPSPLIPWLHRQPGG